MRHPNYTHGVRTIICACRRSHVFNFLYEVECIVALSLGAMRWNIFDVELHSIISTIITVHHLPPGSSHRCHIYIQIFRRSARVYMSLSNLSLLPENLDSVES